MSADAAQLPEPIGPFDYAWYIPVLGVLALTLAAVWCVWLALPSRPECDAAQRLMPVDADDYAARLEEVCTDFTNGRTGRRETHARVAHLTRAYVAHRTGEDLSTATLASVSRDHPELRRLLELAYPGMFGVRSTDPAAIIEHAREVVHR